ncbi:hypothetical protein DOY81_010257 [Sarcophaga bullata]|nr:hypothetical protein DOY81_010257 [Sarcophaga bullata]
MLKMPKSINFGRSYAVHTDWSLTMLETKGINCYDEDSRRILSYWIQAKCGNKSLQKLSAR